MQTLEHIKHGVNRFISRHHCDGRHFGALSSFGSTWSPGTLDSSSAGLRADVTTMSAGGRGALYDAISQSVSGLTRAQTDAGRTDVPKAVLLITASRDDTSTVTTSVDDVREVIGDLNFFPSNDSYLLIAGLEDAPDRKLRNLCRNGYGSYHSVADVETGLETLGSELARLASPVRAMTDSSQPADCQADPMQKSRQRWASIPRLDYMLTVDTSVPLD